MNFNVCKEKCGMNKCQLTAFNLNCAKGNGNPYWRIRMCGKKDRECVFIWGDEFDLREPVNRFGDFVEEMFNKKKLVYRYDLSHEFEPGFEVRKHHDFLDVIGVDDDNIWFNHDFTFKSCPYRFLHKASMQSKCLDYVWKKPSDAKSKKTN